MKDQTALPDVRQFLFDNVATYDELEVLLLLQRRPEVEWSVTTTAQALGLLADACQVALENLAGHGLLVPGGNPITFRYAPASKELGEAVEQLQRAHGKDRFAIVQLFSTNAMDRVRAAAIDRLGGALQLRGAKRPR